MVKEEKYRSVEARCDARAKKNRIDVQFFFQKSDFVIPHKMLITECKSNTIEILFNIEGQKSCSMAIFDPRTVKFQIESEFFIVNVIIKFMNSLLKQRQLSVFENHRKSLI